MKTAEDSYTITIKQTVRFQERMNSKKIHSIKFGHYLPRQAWYQVNHARDTGILIRIINFKGGLRSMTDCLVLILLLDWAS